MIRISTIFVAICMVLVSASLGLVLYSVAGISGSESAIVALTALTFLILYNAVSMRLRDRTDVGTQIADLSRGTGHYNLAQGLVGMAIGIGASLSTTLGGAIADQAGAGAAFLSLAALAVIALAIVWYGMPECRPDLPEPPLPSARPLQKPPR